MLRVRDTGAGIPAAMLPKVFDLYAQAESVPGGAQGGLGIGLSLVQLVCTRRGGEVTASSSDGSVFTARIPVGASLVDA